jgi:hypothetical protein
MVILGWPEYRRSDDFRGDWLAQFTAVIQGRFGRFRSGLLLWRYEDEKNARRSYLRRAFRFFSTLQWTLDYSSRRTALTFGLLAADNALPVFARPPCARP